jgi:hypothetical protein
LVKTNNFLGITLLFNKSDILFSADKPIQSFQVFKIKLRENLSSIQMRPFCLHA